MRWLGGKAEELGIEIYPGFSASEVIISRGSLYSSNLLMFFVVNRFFYSGVVRCK